MKKAPEDLNCKCGVLHKRHSSCLRYISGSEAWGRCPSDYNLLQSCALLSKFCLWWRREKALIVRKEEGGKTMMDFWHTGWDSLREGGAAGFTFQGWTVGFVFSCDLWRYQLFLSAAISEGITEMEYQHEALYCRNREWTGSLKLLIMRFIAACGPSLPFLHLNKFGSRFWMSISFITQSAACLSST